MAAFDYTITIRRSAAQEAGSATVSETSERVIQVSAQNDAAALDQVRREIAHGVHICSAAGCGATAAYFIAQGGDPNDPTCRFACPRHKRVLTRRGDIATPLAKTV